MAPPSEQGTPPSAYPASESSSEEPSSDEPETREGDALWVGPTERFPALYTYDDEGNPTRGDLRVGSDGAVFFQERES
jgi:hypothetical protein